jgi:hypothetical protein
VNRLDPSFLAERVWDAWIAYERLARLETDIRDAGLMDIAAALVGVVENMHQICGDLEARQALA